MIGVKVDEEIEYEKKTGKLPQEKLHRQIVETNLKFYQDKK